METKHFFQIINKKLIVSCQALEDEPLHGSIHMAKMSLAAQQGGAAAIRANSVEDIAAIKETIDLPVIGLIKRDYPDSPIFITATQKEVKALMEVKADVIALDATDRKRPNGEKLMDLIAYIKENSESLIMADISTAKEAEEAALLGVDMVATTLSGYTTYTADRLKPDIALIKEIHQKVDIPIIAEGHIQTPAEAIQALDAGAHAVVVGTAITRPQIITERFIAGMKGQLE